jgi:hypothetical protein
MFDHAGMTDFSNQWPSTIHSESPTTPTWHTMTLVVDVEVIIDKGQLLIPHATPRWKDYYANLHLQLKTQRTIGKLAQINKRIIDADFLKLLDKANGRKFLEKDGDPTINFASRTGLVFNFK